MHEARHFASSGFASPVDRRPVFAEGVRWGEGEDDMMEFQAMVGANGLAITGPARILDVLRKAVELFGGNCLKRFFLLNVRERRFKSHLHYEFLMDTAEFIKTGKRGMSILHWHSLLTVPGNSITKKDKAKTTYTMKSEVLNGLTIQNWIRHDHGIEDLIMSMAIIFGTYTA